MNSPFILARLNYGTITLITSQKSLIPLEHYVRTHITITLVNGCVFTCCLDHILNNDNLAKKFYGGTVYQAFLSATSYHRWHSPVSGYILKTELVDGSYYSQTYNIQTDPASPNESQGYICQVAARGILYIQADNPDIGLMVFVSIGMSEVSTNEITVKAGDYVKKGDDIGMFHFGGSTHLLIFQPGVDLEFDLRGQTPGTGKDLFNIPVRSKIAVVKQGFNLER